MGGFKQAAYDAASISGVSVSDVIREMGEQTLVMGHQTWEAVYHEVVRQSRLVNRRLTAIQNFNFDQLTPEQAAIHGEALLR